MQRASHPSRRVPGRFAATLPMAELLRLAAPAILLGLATKVLVYLGTLPFEPARAGDNFLLDLLARISWAFLVCVALELVTALARQRAWLVALTGLVVAPVAFHLGRGIREGALAMLQPSGTQAAAVVAIGLVKGVEYACLGLILASLSERVARPHHFAAAGLAIGLIFGGVILAITASASPQPLGAVSLVNWVVLEVFFPTACALVVFLTEIGLARAAK